jgi:stress response protein SCP2
MSSFELDLTKNASFNLDLSKIPELNNVAVQACWQSNVDLDLDLFVFGLVNNRIPGPDAVVFHKNKTIAGVTLLKDVRSATGNDIEETDFVLDQVKLDHYDIFVFLAESDVKAGKNFGNINSGYINIVNKDNDEVLKKYNLSNGLGNATSMRLGSVMKNDGNWMFVPLGETFNLNPNQMISQYNN